MCIKYVRGKSLEKTCGMGQTEPNARGLVQREILEHSDMAIYPLQGAQMLCCPGQPRGMKQGKDAGKAEEAWAGGVHHE